MAASWTHPERPAGPELLIPRWAWWILVPPACLAVAVLTLRSVQLATTVVLVACVAAVYLRDRRLGIAGVWLLWLLVPGLRRVFGLYEGFTASDPLAVAPFCATALVGGLELLRAELSRRAWFILLAAGGGFAFGVPAGMFIAGPTAVAFALLAYGSAILFFCAGYREPAERPLVLSRVLVFVAAPLSAYALFQVLAPLPAWDTAWLASVPDFQSIGNKEDGTLRSYATLNSPGTLAAVLGIAVVCTITVRRFGPLQVAILVATLAGLAVTLVRSVWISLALALVLTLLVAPRRVTSRIAIVGAIAVLALPAVLGTTGASVGERAGTLTSLASDKSAQDRIATPTVIVPIAVRQPLGIGLGTAGEASRISANTALRATDNAFLSILIQSGLVGLVLVLAAFGTGFVSAVRNVRRRDSNSIAVFAGLVLLTVLLGAGDAFYGVTGAIIWYLIGFAVRSQEHATADATLR